MGKKNKSSQVSEKLTSETENSSKIRKGTSSVTGNLENANISYVEIDDQSDISLNQSINSISTSRSYRQSKPIRAHLVDRYRKEDKKTSSDNLDDSLNNSKQKL